MAYIYERYDIRRMRVRPRNGNYRLYYLGDLATRITKSRQGNGGVMTEAVQTDYDRLRGDDRPLVDDYLKVDEYLETLKEEIIWQR
jgi:hypothetical protein